LHITQANALRWHLFKLLKPDQGVDKLPPTPGAWLRRAHLQANIWSQDLVLHPTTLDPLTLGWRKDSDRLLSVLSKEPPAPDAVLQLVRCNCGFSSGKVQSSSKTCSCRCSCRSNSLVCTELCNCEAAEDEYARTHSNLPLKRTLKKSESKFLVLRTVIQRTYSCSVLINFRAATYYYILQYTVLNALHLQTSSHNGEKVL